MSDSLWSHELQYARFPCPSLPPWACSGSCPFSRWYHPTISSSVICFSSCFNLSQHQGLSQWVSSSHQVAKVLELQLQRQSFQWIFRVISFRIDWFDLLAVLGTVKSLIQHHSLKVSVLWHSALFMVQLSHSYLNTGNPIDLTVNTVVLSQLCAGGSGISLLYTRSMSLWEVK